MTLSFNSYGLLKTIIECNNSASYNTVFNVMIILIVISVDPRTDPLFLVENGVKSVE